MIKEAIRRLTEPRDLTTEVCSQAMNEVMSGEATPAQVAAFIVALRMKGETVEEITGCAAVMRARARQSAAVRGTPFEGLARPQTSRAVRRFRS